MSIPARIMAIADTFEAQTSADHSCKRPYKLPVSLNILRGMKQNRHIDSDLFDLFLTSETYRKFAEQFLKHDQVDAVDIRQYLNPANH
ncbi:HD domain-containing phosphohydrolase [Methylomicrobium sp. Wu6]|uniref:HD domain-containing phosphohydrolase n=1 Tax=Methylomicrobium sp. Wu6 TaxID=3107928 RepID=UPI002DD64773|nr:HD domain-containing phosphohydrolase [Methylomicrobium sp. Wu6]